MTTPNDSSTGGYIVPTSAPPLDDDALHDFLQVMVAGITGLDGTLVRPRWQAEPPNWPPFGENWVAIGIVSADYDTFAWETHLDVGAGYDDTQRHQRFNLMCSFYGPNADSYAGRLLCGLGVGQNREAMFLAGMGLVACSGVTAAPMLLKERWLNRSDITVTIRREIRATYPVLSLLTAPGRVSSDSGATAAFGATSA